MPEILKNIKAEDRLKKIRIVSENDDVMGGQPEADGMKENDNNAIFDLACSVMHALAEVAKVDQKAIPQILDALGDSRTAGASQRIVNEVNKLAKAAQTAANQANDKANTANTAAATADKKAVAAQNTANSANAAAQKAQTTADTAFKLLGDLKTINLDTLNSNDKCGVYYQTANANATPERNYPIKLAGTLEVFIAAGMTQRYTVYSTHDVYIRNNYGGKWDAWTKIPNTSDLIKVSDAFGDSRTLAGSQRTINEANRAAKAAQTAANQANDKANTANTAAATADKKAVAAQNKANQLPTPAVDQLPIGASGTAYKLITVAELKKKLGVPAATSIYQTTGSSATGAMSQKAITDELNKLNKRKYKNETANRKAGVTYTNTSSQEMWVFIYSTGGWNTTTTLTAVVDGLGFGISFHNSTNSNGNGGSFAVPAGSTYSVKASNSINTWVEYKA